MMKIRFWGVRGSLATPLSNSALLDKIKTVLKMALKAELTSEEQIPEFIRSLPPHLLLTAGGDTTCVEIQAGEKRLIMDAGSGLRPLGINLLQESGGNPIEVSILMSHTHWDHICGIPFFAPAYNPANKVTVYGPHPKLEERFKYQQNNYRFFPVPLAKAFSFVQLKMRDHFYIGDVEIETMPLKHPGASFGYRITYDNKCVIFATDSEYKDLSAEALKPFTDFFHNADVLIYDAQYTMIENVEKENWGHSNVFTGIDLALEANVKKIVFTHHEPTYDDGKLWDVLNKANEYLDINRSGKELQVHLAFEGGYINL